MNRVLFYGDSNVYGYDPRGMTGGRFEEDVRWTERVGDILRGEWRTYSNGVNGRIIPNNPYALLSLDKTVLSLSPLDLFAVMLGTNDLLGMADPESDQVAVRMRDFIEREVLRMEFRDNRTGILLIAPPRILSRMDEFLQECEAQRRRLATQYDMIAQEFGLFFVDTGAWELDMSFDGVHLSEEGHRQFADHMAQELRELDLTAERRVVDEVVFA